MLTLGEVVPYLMQRGLINSRVGQRLAPARLSRFVVAAQSENEMRRSGTAVITGPESVVISLSVHY
jgi:hypothetical protein